MGKWIRFSGKAIIIVAFLAANLHSSAGERPYLDAARQAAEWIRSSAIRTEQGLTWPADPSDPKSINNTLYAGTPGVVPFFLELYYSTGDKTYLQDATAGADYLLATMDQEKNMGLYEGLPGIGFALEETYKATKDKRYRDGFLGCLNRIKSSAVKAGKGAEWSTVTDIIGGSAGTGLFLLYSADELNNPDWLRLAEEAAARLIELGRPEHGGLKWAMDPEFPRLMPNFSHGTAGIAYFLATLYERTQKKELLNAALAGAKYLLAVARTDGDVCLVFHNEPDGKDLYYLGWCHGPVGTSQLFYRLYRITKDKAWLEWVRRSARGIMASGIPEKETPGFWNNAGICCGLAGVGDYFLNLCRVTSDRAYLDFCRRISARLLAKATREGGRVKWIQAEHRVRPDLLIAQTGLMQGAAGIGLFLLHLDAFEQGKTPRIHLPDSSF